MLAVNEASLSAQLSAFDPIAIALLLALWLPGVIAVRLWVQSDSFDSLMKRMGIRLDKASN